MSQELFSIIAVKWRAPLGSTYNTAIGTQARNRLWCLKMAVLRCACISKHRSTSRPSLTRLISVIHSGRYESTYSKE